MAAIRMKREGMREVRREVRRGVCRGVRREGEERSEGVRKCR
jgi:hypothetical protein